MSTPTRLTPATFAATLRRLDDAGLAQFVADLYEENGWDVSVDGATMTVRRADEGTRRLLAVADGRTVIGRILGRHVDVRAPDDVDEVVRGYRTAHARGEIDTTAADTIDSDDLFHQLLYSVDRSTAVAIWDRHFEADVTIDPGAVSDGDGTDSRLQRVHDRTRENSRQVIGMALVFALVLGAVTIGVTGLGGGPGGDPGTANLGSNDQPATPVGMGASATTETAGGNRGIQTATPDDDGDLTPRDSYYFDTPDTAVLTYIQLTHDSSETGKLRRAWRSMSEADRPTFDAFVESIRSGPRRWITSLSTVDWKPMEHRPTPTDEPGLTRGYVGFYVDGNRVVYRFEIECIQHDEIAERGCWQISTFEFVGFR